MPLFLALFLGHLLGDFVFQPGRLVVAKRNSLSGMLLHTAIVTACTTLVLLGQIARFWPAVVIAAIAHLGIEHLTVRARRIREASGLALFLLDQALHIVSLAIIATLMGAGSRSAVVMWNSSIAVLAALCGVLTVAFLGSILAFEVRVVAMVTTAAEPYCDGSPATVRLHRTRRCAGRQPRLPTAGACRPGLPATNRVRPRTAAGATCSPHDGCHRRSATLRRGLDVRRADRERRILTKEEESRHAQGEVHTRHCPLSDVVASGRVCRYHGDPASEHAVLSRSCHRDRALVSRALAEHPRCSSLARRGGFLPVLAANFVVGILFLILGFSATQYLGADQAKGFLVVMLAAVAIPFHAEWAVIILAGYLIGSGQGAVAALLACLLLQMAGALLGLHDLGSIVVGGVRPGVLAFGAAPEAPFAFGWLAPSIAGADPSSVLTSITAARPIAPLVAQPLLWGLGAALGGMLRRPHEGGARLTTVAGAGGLTVALSVASALTVRALGAPRDQAHAHDERGLRTHGVNRRWC